MHNYEQAYKFKRRTAANNGVPLGIPSKTECFRKLKTENWKLKMLRAQRMKD